MSKLKQTATLRLAPVTNAKNLGPDEEPLSLEESGALGSVKVEVVGLGEYRLDVFIAPSGHDGATDGDLLYVEPCRLTGEDEEGPVGAGAISESEDEDDAPSALAFHFRPVLGFLLQHPTITGKTYCPLPCWGALQEESTHPPGTPCPKCQEWLAKGEEPPDPYAGARMEPEVEEDEEWESGDEDLGADDE